MNIRAGLCFMPLLLLAGCSALPGLKSPDSSSSEALQPKNASPFLTLQAKGNQFFRCTVDNQGTFWKFERPQAILTDQTGNEIAELSGPMQAFDHRDGSRIISSRIIAWANPANPSVDNKLALFSAVADDKPGEFNGTKYIQRLNTVGGLPKGNCTPDEKGKIQKVPFKAEFVFWK